MATNSYSPEIKINPNTPVWGIAQLMEFISENGQYSTQSDILIAQNPNSGYIYAWSEDWLHALVADSDGKVYRHFNLWGSGLEFFEYEISDIEYSELKTDDQLQFLDILEEINTTDSRELAEKLTEQQEQE